VPSRCNDNKRFGHYRTHIETIHIFGINDHREIKIPATNLIEQFT
jgi:hypothetical protein